MHLALFYLSVLHSVLLPQHDRPTHIHDTTIHTHTHIRTRTPKDTAKNMAEDTAQTHKHTHIHARQCLTNRYVLTHTNTHIHTHTYNMRAFEIAVSDGWVDFCNHRSQTYSHPHYLRASTASSCPTPPPRIFFTLPLVQVIGQNDSGNGRLWTAVPAQRVLSGLTTAGRVRLWSTKIW